MAQPGQNLRDVSFSSSSSDSTHAAMTRQRSISGDKVRKTVEYFESTETAVISEDERPVSPNSAERRPSVSQKLRDKMKELALAMDQDTTLVPVPEVTESTKTTATSVIVEEPASSPAPMSIITNPAILASTSFASSSSATVTSPSSSAGVFSSTPRQVVTTPEFDRYLEKRRLEAQSTTDADSLESPIPISPADVALPSSASSMAESSVASPSKRQSDYEGPLSDHMLSTLTGEETDYSDLTSPRFSGAFHTAADGSIVTGGTQKSQSSSSAVHVARVSKLLPVLKVFQKPTKHDKPARSLKDRHSINSSNEDINRSWSGSSSNGSGRSQQSRKRGFLPWQRKNKEKRAKNKQNKRYSEADPAIVAMEQQHTSSDVTQSPTSVTNADANAASPSSPPFQRVSKGKEREDVVEVASDGSWVTDRSESSGEADHTGLGEELSRNIPMDKVPPSTSLNTGKVTSNTTKVNEKVRRQSSRDSISCSSCLEYAASTTHHEHRRPRSRASSLTDLRHNYSNDRLSEHHYHAYPHDTSNEPNRRFSSDTAETRSLDRALSQNERHRRSIRWRSDDHYSIAWRDATAARGDGSRGSRDGHGGGGARRHRGNVEQYWADRTFDDRDSRYPSTRRTHQSTAMTARRPRLDSRGYDVIPPLPSRCELCFEYAREYRVLPCQHTYCRTCLQRIIDDENLRQRSWSSLPHPHQTMPPPPPAYLNNLMMPAPPGSMMMPGRPPFAPGLPMPGFFPQSMPTPGGYPMGVGSIYRPGGLASPPPPHSMITSGIGDQGEDVTLQRMEEGEVAVSDVEDDGTPERTRRKRNRDTTSDKKDKARNEIIPPVVRLPNRKRLYLRLVQLIAAIGAFGFLVSAKPHSNSDGPPFEDRSAIYFLYVLAAVSFCLAMAHVVYFYLRLKRGRAKFNQWYICGIDFFMFLFWGAEVGVLLSKNSCPSGTYNGWCTFFNVAIFWGFASFIGHGVATVWDLTGIWIASRRRAQQRQQNELQTRTTLDPDD